jgi:urea carboxylase
MAGGLATTTTIVRGDFWRLGQCRPGDTIRLKRISWKSALTLRQRIETYIQDVKAYISENGKGSDIKPLDLTVPDDWDETILHHTLPDTEGSLEIKYRQVSRGAFRGPLLINLGRRLPYSRHIR